MACVEQMRMWCGHIVIKRQVFDIWVNMEVHINDRDVGGSDDEMAMVNSRPPSDSLGAVLGHTHITIDQLFGIVSTIMREAGEAVEADMTSSTQHQCFGSVKDASK